MKISACIVALIATLVADCASAPETSTFEFTPTQLDQQPVEKLYAKIAKIDGPVDEVLITLPNLPEAEGHPEACVDMVLPEGTEICTGDATVILKIFFERDGQPTQESMISIRHTSMAQIDSILVDPKSKSAIARMKVATGEVRVKLTDESDGLTDSASASTPKETASVR